MSLIHCPMLNNGTLPHLERVPGCMRHQTVSSLIQEGSPGEGGEGLRSPDRLAPLLPLVGRKRAFSRCLGAGSPETPGSPPGVPRGRGNGAMPPLCCGFGACWSGAESQRLWLQLALRFRNDGDKSDRKSIQRANSGTSDAPGAPATSRPRHPNPTAAAAAAAAAGAGHPSPRRTPPTDPNRPGGAIGVAPAPSVACDWSARGICMAIHL